ncbi:MAG: ATP-binding domain-containing protein, partial [Coprococcus sp.]
IDRDSSAFRKGLTVTTFYLAKGLEFDQVFAVCPDRGDALAKQARYICATRALHELYMYEIG